MSLPRRIEELYLAAQLVSYKHSLMGSAFRIRHIFLLGLPVVIRLCLSKTPTILLYVFLFLVSC